MTGNDLSPMQVRIVNSMHEQSVRMVQLVNNLLEMARLESGHVQLRKDWQSLEDLVGGAVKVRQDILSHHHLKVELPPDIPLVNCDATLIERVLVNLLENAAKYTPQGTTITVTAVARPHMLTVTVFDEGPGLPRGQEQVLFEKFVRGQKESGTPGVGLGLAICRAIVEAHGGTIEAVNRVEGGASFAFSLPLSKPSVMVEANSAT